MLCVIISRRSFKRSRPNLVNDSVYERAGNNSFKQRFCTHSISFDSFFRQTRMPNRTCIFKNRANYRGINTHNITCRGACNELANGEDDVLSRGVGTG